MKALGILAASCFLCLQPLIADETPQTLLGGTSTQDDLTLVDPEFSNTPLPKLVLPPDPPAMVNLPEVIVKKDEWKGSQSAVVDARFAVFRHDDKWASFWQQALAPYSPRLAKIPKIDFTKDMVVGVFLGEKPTPHYEIEIRSITEEKSSSPVLQSSSATVLPAPNGSTGAPEHGSTVLVVRYKEITRMSGVFVPPFAVQPFHLKKIPAYAGPVVFSKVRR